MWIGTHAGGIWHWTTYSYSNLNNGAGNTNVHNNMLHKNRIMSWHFIYYGYSRAERKAHIYVKCRSD